MSHLSPMVLVSLMCHPDLLDQVHDTVNALFAQSGQPIVGVRVMNYDISTQSGQRLLIIDTGRPYTTDKAALDLWQEPGYISLSQIPGVLAVDVVSSLAERPVAMTELEAQALATRIRHEASWLQQVSVKCAHKVNDAFFAEEELFVCWLEGLQFSSEIYNPTDWGILWEQLDYEHRINVFLEQLEETDGAPFHRYVLDSPVLPHPGKYDYISMERRAASSYLRDSSMPPWRSVVRSDVGVKAIYALSGIRVPLSVAPYSLRVGDQALVVTQEGDVGLLIRVS